MLVMRGDYMYWGAPFPPQQTVEGRIAADMEGGWTGHRLESRGIQTVFPSGPVAKSEA